MSERMFQSGLSRLRSVLSGGTGGTGEVQDRERRHSAVVRSSSQNPRSDLARQILSKKLSVPVLPSHHQLHHPPVQVSRSVPCPPTQHLRQPHRQLSRATPSHLSHKYRRQDRSSIWAKDQHGGKRIKQDLNRNIQYYNGNDFDGDSEGSAESNPEDHIYEEIDSDTLSTHDEDQEMEEDNFLLSISRERQRNLKFYGSAGWDFGSVS